MTRCKAALLAAFIVFSGVLVASPAMGGHNLCGNRNAMVRTLDEKYGESLRFAGLAGQSWVELYASDETGSWTILVTSTRGNACLRMAGEAFRVGPVIKEEGDDT